MASFQFHPWELRKLRPLLNQTHDATQLRRAQGLLWLHDGQPITAVTDLLQVSRQTLYNWVRAFTDRRDLGAADRLLDAPRGGRSATSSGTFDRFERRGHR